MKKKTKIVATISDEISSALCIRVSYRDFTNEMAVGSKILIDDGYIGSMNVENNLHFC